MTGLIAQTFKKLKENNKKAFIPFIMAGDPERETFRKLLMALPEAGADLIEVGMPFTDPMADGETIQEAGIRALKSGQNLKKTLEDIAFFKSHFPQTPIILMGYYNPIYRYGTDKFFKDFSASGGNGVIIVDLPPEEHHEIESSLEENNIDIIRLITPTTTPERLQLILKKSTAFLYYVAVTGVTGQKSADYNALKQRIETLKHYTELPIGVGFGLKDASDIQSVSQTGADAMIMGSAIVKHVAQIKNKDISEVVGFIRECVS